MNFVLAEPLPGEDSAAVAERISGQTGLLAITQQRFFWNTINYMLGSTGIPVNFGITIALGFIVGVAVAGANVLSVHARKPEALRLAQSDGGEQPAADRHHPAASD